jgi:hypothetical protein
MQAGGREGWIYGRMQVGSGRLHEAVLRQEPPNLVIHQRTHDAINRHPGSQPCIDRGALALVFARLMVKSTLDEGLSVLWECIP